MVPEMLCMDTAETRCYCRIFIANPYGLRLLFRFRACKKYVLCRLVLISVGFDAAVGMEVLFGLCLVRETKYGYNWEGKCKEHRKGR